jgi:4,5-DOPA dioxygenase extradiol
MAQELGLLREKQVLIIGSGNIVHNLGLIDYDINAAPFDWAVRFDEKIKQRLIKAEHKLIIDYLGLGEEAPYAVPTLDHYLPMIYAMALQREGEPLKLSTKVSSMVRFR